MKDGATYHLAERILIYSMLRPKSYSDNKHDVVIQIFMAISAFLSIWNQCKSVINYFYSAWIALGRISELDVQHAEGF